MFKKILKYSVILLFILFICSLIFKKEKTFRVLNQILPLSLTGAIKFFTEININTKKINNDYNVKFLPNTQNAVLDFQKNKLSFVTGNTVRYFNFLKAKPFVFDVYNKYLIIAPKSGSFHYQLIDDIILDKKKFKEITSNLDTNNVKDIFIDNQVLYVSYVKKIDDCKFLFLAKSKINLVKLNFTNIFESNECMRSIESGRIQKTKLNNDSLILLATAADVFMSGPKANNPMPQDNKSIYGKIISINESNYDYSIYSKGHRNILGLSSIDNVILSTENGPRGGDEINRIYKNKNYGWPIASNGNMYVIDFEGKKYGRSLTKDYAEHLDMNFEPPIFSFIPSIGISEIIKIDNNFDVNWQDNYLIGSLFGNHLYRVRFNKMFNKVDYFEKIFIGERIRDLKYIPSHSVILMALESTGSIGILKNLHMPQNKLDMQ